MRRKLVIEILFSFFLLASFPLNARCGASEVDKIAKDRPQILDVISPGDEIWKWLESSFQSTNGLPAKWSPESPNLPSHYLSAHRFNAKGEATIMVEGVRPDGTHIGGEEVLSMLVFELLNASHRDEFKALDAAASERKIGKENYIEGMAKVEFTTALELKHFAVHLWPQNAVKRGMPWNHPFWKQGTVESFDIYLRTIRGMHDGYPDDVFGPRYDALSKGEVH